MNAVWAAASAAMLLAAAPAAADEADALALQAFQATQLKPGVVVAHIDLTQPFKSRTPWTFVAVQGPDEAPHDATGDMGAGRILMCLAHAGALDCQGPEFRPPLPGAVARSWDGEIVYHHELAARVATIHGRPLLLLTASSLPYGDGGRLISTFLLGYDRKSDRFVGLFANWTGTNRNQKTRLIESGPLAGDIVVDEPTPNAPFRYFVTVYQSSPSGPYGQRLRYRSRTGYNDGNVLSVIDSEMPEILRRLNLRKAGGPLPEPLDHPLGVDCRKLELRRGVEWCAPA